MDRNHAGRNEKNDFFATLLERVAAAWIRIITGLQRGSTACALAAIIVYGSGAAHPFQSLIPFEDPSSGLWGYKSVSGQQVIPPRYYVAGPFSFYGIAAVADLSGWHYIDGQGTIIVKTISLGVSPFVLYADFYQIQGDTVASLLRKRIRGPAGPGCVYEATRPGAAAVPVDTADENASRHGRADSGMWSFFTMKGDIMLQPRFERIESFQREKSQSVLDGRWFLLIQKGW